MPATPLHCSIAYLVSRWKPKVILPALLVSSMVPDLEIPFVYLMTRGLHHRLILHSLLGAATKGTLLSVFLTVCVYPMLVSFFFKLDKEMVKEKCRFSGNLIVLCFFGTLSHVFIDSLHHEYNPVLYPFVNDSFDAFVLLNDWILASGVVTCVLLVLLIFFFVSEVRKGTRGFWVRMLVGGD